MDSDVLFSSHTVEEIRAVEHKTRLLRVSIKVLRTFAPRFSNIGFGATTECRATFKHSPNEPARLAQEWMKERGIIVGTLSVGFIYLVARLARQWKNFYGVKC